MIMKLYICAPITLGGTCTPEQEEANTQRIHDAERELVEAGYQVQSPVKIRDFLIDLRLPLPGDGELIGDGLARWQWYMRRTLIQMLTCHGVATLPRVEQSSGCITELSIANRLGLPTKSHLEWLQLADKVPLPNPIAEHACARWNCNGDHKYFSHNAETGELEPWDDA